MTNTPPFHQPVSARHAPLRRHRHLLPLPYVERKTAETLDIAVLGVPWDGGTTNRPGPRHGPRQMRDQSAMVRRMHQTSHVVPYDLANIADIGDAPVNPANVDDALARVEGHYAKLVAKGIRPLTAGGDHLTSLPIFACARQEESPWA